MMNDPKLCVSITSKDTQLVKKVAPNVDLFEVRIDLIGRGWQEVAAKLSKPWIACNRKKEEGGRWRGSESARLDQLLKAVSMGADIVDIELSTPDVSGLVEEIKGEARCLISYHNVKITPPLSKMRDIVQRQQAAGADICKVVTIARSLQDNRNVLRLIKECPQVKLVSFAMGPLGQISRILSPLAGGYFTYASVAEGRESAAGQMTAADLKIIYKLLDFEK
jgi:3-dehydroquinate dehydratase type I